MRQVTSAIGLETGRAVKVLQNFEYLKSKQDISKMKSIPLLFLFFVTLKLFSQGYPWEQPLKIAFSNDGITFNVPSTFQDSSGVPSVIKWKGDTLICAFQWFRGPVGSASWDRVAVKFSYDNGTTWTQPAPIVINGLPLNYQRPFDPTLVAYNGDSIRIYFSSSDGFPIGGMDSTINTYSAKSTDGIQYTFEAGARVDEPANRVIDPAVIYFKNGYHYISPIGSPQQGAYHYVSPNGLNFMKVPDIPSDPNHNWTGNYMINNTDELRFYGTGTPGVWYNSTPNGGIWNGYVNTNIQGGDPSVLKVADGSYLAVYVGNPYSIGINHEVASENSSIFYPNPARNQIRVKPGNNLPGTVYTVYDNTGKLVLTGKINPENNPIELGNLPGGIYLFRVGENPKQTFKVIKE
jgi:hypothetical protein